MAAPVYSTDLITVATADEASGWVQLTGTDGNGKVYNAQSAPAYQSASYPSIQKNQRAGCITCAPGLVFFI